MKEIDVNISRDYLKKMFPKAEFDKEYTFYYDETNNIKKLYVRESGLNSPFSSNFILGGLVFEDSLPDLSELFEGLKLQKSVKDVKLKHLAKGEFLECLKSKKLNFFLQFLFDNKILIHFSWVNLLHWSITDIVDSAIANSEVAKKVGRLMVDKVRSDLYKLAKIEIDKVLEIFFKYQYPNIKKENVVPFIDEFTSLFYDYIDTEEFHFGLESLRQVLKEARRNESLPYIMDEEDYMLLKDFSSFYLESICLFKNSNHIFDNEESISEILSNTKIMDKQIQVKNYSFVDSHNNLMIQASDIIVGIFGKFSGFINKTSYDEVKLWVDSLSEIQEKNIDLIIDLMNRSAKINPAFISSIDCQEETDKIGLICIMRDKL